MNLKITSFLCETRIRELTYVVVDTDSNEAFIVDPGTRYSEVMPALDGMAVRYIILTHAHPDHIIRLPEFRAALPGVPLVMHPEDQDMLGSADINDTQKIYGYTVEDKADIYVNDGDTLPFGDDKITFIHTPGHTKGGMCILVGKDMFSGDTLFYRTVGRTDLYGGDWETLKASIRDKLFCLDDDIDVYPGHGRPTTIGSEKRANPFV
ncbi:MAG: MBL fold metallo-hydrolase [Mogibacterium sp.]|nr:MBL fold metallo-hydrolase [Mogibacterium sp.]